MQGSRLAVSAESAANPYRNRLIYGSRRIARDFLLGVGAPCIRLMYIVDS